MANEKSAHLDELEQHENKMSKQSIRQMEHLRLPSSAHIVMEHREWYETVAKRLTLGAIPMAFALAIVVIALATMANRPPDVLEYLMDDDGDIIALQSTRNAAVTDTEVLSWTAERVIEVNQLTGTDYVKQVRRLRKYFVPEAYMNFQRMLISTKTIEKIKADNLYLTAKPDGAPVIERKGLDSGTGEYTWIIKMPIEQLMQGGSFSVLSAKLEATIWVRRAPRTGTLSGLVIEKLLYKER